MCCVMVCCQVEDCDGLLSGGGLPDVLCDGLLSGGGLPDVLCDGLLSGGGLPDDKLSHCAAAAQGCFL